MITNQLLDISENQPKVAADALTTKTLPVMNIISAVEEGLKLFGNSRSVDIARAKITQILSNWRPPTPNLTEEEFKAL